MSILLFGDIHMGDHKAFALPASDFPSSRVRIIVQSLRWLLTQVEEHEPSLVVCLGDLIHHPQESNYFLLGLLAEFFENLAKYPGVQVEVLVGNHDANERPSGGMPYRRPVQEIVARAVHVIDRSRQEGDIAFLPYYADLSKVLHALPPGKMVFCHTDVQEHPYGGKRLGPSVAEFPCEEVYSGHVHRGQLLPLEKGQPRFEYVGALLPTSFADQGEEFGALLLTDEGCRRLVNPHAVPFRKVSLTEPAELPDFLDSHAYYLVDLFGSEAYCLDRAEQVRRADLPWVRVRLHPDLPEDVVEVKEEETLEEAEDPARYVDDLIARWAEAHGGDPETGQRLYRGEEV